MPELVVHLADITDAQIGEAGQFFAEGVASPMLSWPGCQST